MSILNKIIIVGDGAVGKTTFVRFFLRGEILTGYKATVGVDIGKKVLILDDNRKVIFQLWDLSGQKAFQSIRKQFYNRANGAIIVYDISRRETFDNIDFWYEEIFSIAGDIPTVLVANKIDLRDELDDYVRTEEGESLIKRIIEKYGSYNSFVEASALKQRNSMEPFKKLGEMIIELSNYNKDKQNSTLPDDSG